jgi:endonuclease YncB( thermonuclease family)
MRIRGVLFFLFIVIVFFLFAYYLSSFTGRVVENREIANVTNVIDGDTIEVRLGLVITKVRLLGINTPEKNMPGYQEAKDYLRQLEGKEVELVKDKEDVDKYNRKLRFVFYDNEMINLEILRRGLANYYSYGSSYDADLLEAEDSARVGELGLWKKSGDKCASCIILVNLDKGGQEGHTDDEQVIFGNICDFNCDMNGWTMKDDANHIYKFNNAVSAMSEFAINQKGVWNDQGDSLFLRDKEGGLVIFWRY